jgi:hypothetical protein
MGLDLEFAPKTYNFWSEKGQKTIFFEKSREIVRKFEKS